MKQEKKTLSYYRLRLEVYLKDYHPQLLSDETFIRERSEAAAQTYEEAFLQDNPIGIAESMAMEVLLGGLHFSPYQVIEQIIDNEFANEVPAELSGKLSLLLLEHKEVKDTFDRYHPRDDFDEKPEYDGLYTELTGTIATVIEEHDLLKDILR